MVYNTCNLSKLLTALQMEIFEHLPEDGIVALEQRSSNLPTSIKEALLNHPEIWEFKKGPKGVTRWHKKMPEGSGSYFEDIKIQGEGSTLRWTIGQGSEHMRFFLTFDLETGAYENTDGIIRIGNSNIIFQDQVFLFFNRNQYKIGHTDWTNIMVSSKYSHENLSERMIFPGSTFTNPSILIEESDSSN
jgi:hypothetical protein